MKQHTRKKYPLYKRELELELIQSHMAQKPMLRGEVGARALRVRSDVRGHGQVRLCKALGCGRCGCLKPIRACCVVGSAFFLVAPPRGGCAMAPRDSGMCWKQFMMCLEEIQFLLQRPIQYMKVRVQIFVPPPQWGGLDLYSIQAAAIEAARA